MRNESVDGNALSYPFLVRAFCGRISGFALCLSVRGSAWLLKRYSMIGDGLSHVSFGALSVAIAVGWSPLAVSIPVVCAGGRFSCCGLQRTAG